MDIQNDRRPRGPDTGGWNGDVHRVFRPSGMASQSFYFESVLGLRILAGNRCGDPRGISRAVHASDAEARSKNAMGAREKTSHAESA